MTLKLSHLRCDPRGRVFGSPGHKIPKSQISNVVQKIELFPTNHVRPVSYACKYMNIVIKVVGGTSDFVILDGIFTRCLYILTLVFLGVRVRQKHEAGFELFILILYLSLCITHSNIIGRVHLTFDMSSVDQ